MSLLAQPLQLGPLTVPNRIMQAAHSKQYSDRVESERETAYFVRRAQGGCGLFVAGNHFVHPSASIRGFQDAWRPESVAANRRLTAAVHDAGAAILVQLNHHGAQAPDQGPSGPRPVLAPSRMLSPATGLATRAASRRELAELERAWADSAELAREGGFDGVEVHLAHGYLLHQFLSPLFNHREDEYAEDPTLFPRQVLRAVRERVGDDFCVGIRVVVHEHHEGGLDAEVLRGVVRRLREDVRLDFLDPAAGGYHDVHWVFPSSAMPVSWLREDMAALKVDNPDIAVFGVGCARSVEEAEEVVASGIADTVALTRGQLADPDLARKLLAGDTSTVRHCIRLNQGCLGRGSRGLPVGCTVNPDAGRESEPPPPEASPESWVVVGGGPAGLRAALDLAGRGHAVTLLEAGDVLGGQARVAAQVPGREQVAWLVADLERDVRAAGVDVRLSTTADLALLQQLAPDQVVLATGADLGEVGAALADPHALGEQVLVVDDDGTSYASGVLLTLVAAGLDVHVVTGFDRLLPHVGSGYDRDLVLRTLAGARFERTVESVVSGGAVRDLLTGRVSDLPPHDTLLTIGLRKPVLLEPGDEDELARRLGVPVHVIGDARSPRDLDAAIHEAWALARA